MPKEPTITLTFTLTQYDAIQRAVIKADDANKGGDPHTREESIAYVCEDWEQSQ